MHVELKLVGAYSTQVAMLDDLLKSSRMKTEALYFTKDSPTPDHLRYALILGTSTQGDGTITVEIRMELVQKDVYPVMLDGSRGKKKVDVITPPTVLTNIMHFINDPRALILSTRTPTGDIVDQD